MKKLLLLSTFAFGLFTFAFSQKYGWKDISANIPDFPFDTTYNISGDTLVAALTDVYFINDNEGWITTWHPQRDSAAILHTTDGGETFEIQITPILPCFAIHMLDENNGYCGGEDGLVYKTDNGGLDWNHIGSMGSLCDISFPIVTNPSNPIGYASGDHGTVYSIAGTSVTNLNSPSSATLRGISAPSIDNVWVCGGNRIYYYNGSTFTSQPGPTGTFNDIHFIDNQKGWVVGNVGLIGHTDDGGANWTTQTNPDPQNRSLYGVFFFDADYGWAVGVDGVILHTTDGGTNWAIVGEGLTTENLTSIHFTSATNGYIVGGGKTLLKFGELSGIEDGVETISFEIFPNPAQNEFRVSGYKLQVGGATIKLYDLNGKKLLEKNITAGTEEIEMDVSRLESGIYLCSLTTEKGNATKKLMIK